jgi:hypothetical protein
MPTPKKRQPDNEHHGLALYFRLGSRPAAGWVVSNTHGAVSLQTDHRGRLATGVPAAWCRAGSRLTATSPDGRQVVDVTVRVDPETSAPLPIQLTPDGQPKPNLDASRGGLGGSPLATRFRHWLVEFGRHVVVVGALTVAAALAAVVLGTLGVWK